MQLENDSEYFICPYNVAQLVVILAVGKRFLNINNFYFHLYFFEQQTAVDDKSSHTDHFELR